MDYRKRIHAPRGYDDPGHAHELTISCFQKYAFLSKERTCEWLAQQLDLVRRELNYELYAYVFMPDHAHMIVMPQERKYETGAFLKRLKEPVSRKAVQFLKKEAPEWLEKIRCARGKKSEYHFWQRGRGYDRNITKGRTLLKMVDYLHENPERKRLVRRARDWKWSSAGWFEGQPLNWLEPDPIPPEWLEEGADVQ